MSLLEIDHLTSQTIPRFGDTAELPTYFFSLDMNEYPGWVNSKHLICLFCYLGKTDELEEEQKGFQRFLPIATDHKEDLAVIGNVEVHAQNCPGFCLFF